MKRVYQFIVLTFSISWLTAIVFYLAGGRWNTPLAVIIAVLYMFVPMASAIILQKYIYQEPVTGPLGISWKLNWWWLIAWLLPAIFSIVTFGVSLLFPGIKFSPEMAGMFEIFKDVLTPEQIEQMKKAMEMPVHPFWIALIQGLSAGITINAIAGFGEELGWRGFLLKELKDMSFWKASFIIGLIWGIWHAPLIIQGHNYPQHPEIGVLMMTIFCILFTPIFVYVRLRAKSVIAAAILHGTLNGTAGLSIILVAGGNDLTVGIMGLSGFLVLLLFNAGIFIFDRQFTIKKIYEFSDGEELVDRN